MTIKVSKIAKITQKVLSSRTSDREPAEIISERRMAPPYAEIKHLIVSIRYNVTRITHYVNLLLQRRSMVHFAIYSL